MKVLRSYFCIIGISKNKMFAMPSIIEAESYSITLFVLI
jgi:hypothetical protein